MNEVDMICAAIGVSEIVLGFVLWRLVRVRPTVIGSELDRRWANVEHAHAGRAHTGGGIAEMNLGPITASKPILARADHGQFGTGNRPTNAGTSKQIERLHLAGVPHASAVAMLEADCTQNERRVIHMREQGDSLTLIADRLGVSVSKVRRLELSAVNKILAARKEPS